jgi:hypothetical protein
MAIRPFSGNPPKCDVCGWVCDPSRNSSATVTAHCQDQTNEDRESVGQLIKKDIKKIKKDIKDGIAGIAGCLLVLVYLALGAAGLLIFVAVVIWAWRLGLG